MSDGWFGSWSGEEAPDAGPSAAIPRLEHLDALPSAGRVYASALARAGRAVVMSNEASTALPEVALGVDGFALDRERLDTYARLIGEPALEVAPPAFVHVSVFGLQLALMARTDFPLPMLGMVHTANRIEQLRPVRTDEQLSATTWARQLTARPVGSDGTGTQVDLVTEVRTQGGGEVLWQGVSTYLAKGTQLAGLPFLPRAERGEFVPPAPTGGWTTSAATSRQYAAVSGDRNPIHTSTLAAKAFGFPRTIAHGMDTAARALAALGPARGDAFTWSVEFAAPVVVPGQVAVRVDRRGDTDASDGGVRPGFDLTVWDPKRGRLHLTSVLAFG